MPRLGEYTYYEKIGAEGRAHAVGKPFSDQETSRFFLDMGAVFSLLPPPPARVLECGCGTGWFSCFLAQKGYDVVGQDCSEDAVKLAEANPSFGDRQKRVEFVAGDFEKMGFENEFDAVLFYASLHHTVSLEAALESVYKALKKDGLMIAIEPGVGHAKRSSHEIEDLDLGDRDMPPKLVIRTARATGFSSWETYQHPGQLASVLYGEKPHSGLLSRLFHIQVFRAAVLLYNLLYHKRNNGTVLLRK